MRRANGFLLGTILVILIGGVVIIQALNAPQDAPDGEDPGRAAAAAANQAAPATPSEPSMDELENSVTSGKGEAMQTPPSSQSIAPTDKFGTKPEESTLPNTRWWERSD